MKYIGLLTLSILASTYSTAIANPPPPPPPPPAAQTALVKDASGLTTLINTLVQNRENWAEAVAAFTADASDENKKKMIETAKKVNDVLSQIDWKLSQLKKNVEKSLQGELSQAKETVKKSTLPPAKQSALMNELAEALKKKKTAE